MFQRHHAADPAVREYICHTAIIIIAHQTESSALPMDPEAHQFGIGSNILQIYRMGMNQG